jgi:hypothetical protein
VETHSGASMIHKALVRDFPHGWPRKLGKKIELELEMTHGWYAHAIIVFQKL